MYLIDEYLCVYELEEKLARTETPIWKVYIILSEAMVRIGPCVLLIILNLLMIRDFTRSLNRRMSLNTTLVHPSPPMSRKRKITISSYVQSCEDVDKAYDTLSKGFSSPIFESITKTDKRPSKPLVINVSNNYRASGL